MIALSFAEGDRSATRRSPAPLRERFISVERVAEVLAEMGIYTDNHRPALDDWLARSSPRCPRASPAT